MNADVQDGIRSVARRLPLEKRHALLERARGASDSLLLRAVISVGIGSGEWRSTSDVADRVFAIDDRSLRRWLADPGVVLSRAVRERLEALAWVFAVDVDRAAEAGS